MTCDALQIGLFYFQQGGNRGEHERIRKSCDRSELKVRCMEGRMRMK